MPKISRAPWALRADRSAVARVMRGAAWGVLLRFGDVLLGMCGSPAARVAMGCRLAKLQRKQMPRGSMRQTIGAPIHPYIARSARINTRALASSATARNLDHGG